MAEMFTDPCATSPELKLENQLCFPLYACARRVVNLYTPWLKPLGLTYTQYLVLMVLWEQRRMTVGDLCRKLFLDNGTITPLLKKLEAAGWVTRERSHQDERVVEILLTDAGLSLREKVREIPACIGNMIPLTPEEAAQLYSLLYKVLSRADGTVSR